MITGLMVESGPRLSANRPPAGGPRLGIDLGGSKILAVVIDGHGRVVGKAKRATKSDAGYRAVLQRIVRTSDEALVAAGLDDGARAILATVGVGVPGPVDPGSGQVLVAPNLGWGAKDVGRDLGALLKRRVVLGNDANFGALGEATHGAAAGRASACAVFVGTGLGAATVIAGKVVNGAHGFAGEIGHVQAPFDQAPCGCGRTGCLEVTASKVGISRLLIQAIEAGKPCAVRKPEKLKAARLRKAWKEGCPASRWAVKHCARALGWGLSVLGAATDPEVFVLGGGVIDALGPQMLPEILQSMRDRFAFYRRNRPELVLAGLGGEAVAIGAAVASGTAVQGDAA